MMGKLFLNGEDTIGRLREEIERTEIQIEENLRQIGGGLSVESLSRMLAARGSEFFTERLKPAISGLGVTMKATLNKVLDSVRRDPLPVFIMGAGAGLVLLSLYSGRKSDSEVGWEENVEEKMEEEAMTGSVEEETRGFGKTKPGVASFGSMALGLSVLALGVAMSGVLPGINSEKVEELKTDLFYKAVETGEEFIKSTERILKERLSP